MCPSRIFYAYVSKHKCVIFFPFQKNWTIHLGAIYILVHSFLMLLFFSFLHQLSSPLNGCNFIQFILSVPFKRTTGRFQPFALPRGRNVSSCFKQWQWGRQGVGAEWPSRERLACFSSEQSITPFESAHLFFLPWIRTTWLGKSISVSPFLKSQYNAVVKSLKPDYLG